MSFRVTAQQAKLYMRGGKTVAVQRIDRASRHARAGFGLDHDGRREVRSVTIDLPAPPSLNNLFVNIAGRGRIKSTAYQEWIRDAGWILQVQNPGCVSGPYSVTLLANRHDARFNDLDNGAKAAVDLLVKHRVVEDDSLCESLTIKWGNPRSGMRVTVTKRERGYA